MNKNAVKMTEKIVKIQGCINNDPEITIVEISKKTGIPIATISRLIKQFDIHRTDRRYYNKKGSEDNE